MDKYIPKISIIVPVYNVEKYLERCVQSILNQTFKDLELILVDDGSSDNSGKLCDFYAEQDSRIIVVHKNNEGPSSARNAGLEIAQGNYIGFVDSDDYIAKDMYEMLYNNIKNENADISTCGMFEVYKGRESRILPQYYNVVDNQKALEFVLKRKFISVNVWDKLFKKEVFQSVSFIEKKISEDAFLIVSILMEHRKIVISSQQKYYYIRHQGSLTTNKFMIQDLEGIEVWKQSYHLISEKFPMLHGVAKVNILWSEFSVLDKIIIERETKYLQKIKNEIVKDLKENTWLILKCPEIKLVRKVAFLSLLLSERLYKNFVLLKRKRHPLS